MKKLGGLKFLFKFDNFWDLAVRRLSSKYKDVSIYDLKTGPSIVDRAAGDSNGIWACLDWGEYDMALEILNPILKAHASIGVLDCGANVGGFGLLLASRGFLFREYHAVEMNPRAMGRASFNLTNWHGQPPALVVNAAIAEESGWISIEDIPGDTGQSIYRSIDENERPTIAIKKVTIKDLLDVNSWSKGLPDLIKIDIEGAEFDAIPQLTEGFLENTSAIIVEIHPLRERDPLELVNHLSYLNFECVLSPKNTPPWGVYVFSRRGFSDINKSQ
jgi:FkbM family methyltransferase